MSKKIILIIIVAFSFLSESSYSSIEIQAEQEWLQKQHPNPKARTAFYIKYAHGNKKNAKAAIQTAGARIDSELDEYNTMAISLPSQAASAIKNIPHIIFYESVPEYQLQSQITPWNIDQFQARDVWDKDRNGVIDAIAPTGNGIKFCIIDTGFFAMHSDFKGIVHSGLSQIPGEVYTEDGYGHGTHVAGIANAVNNDIGVVGVMPGGAEFFIVKIFNNDGFWSEGNSNLGDAILSCKDNGANVISMSLGGNNYSATEEAIFQDLYDNYNIISIAAAGNSGNATRSYPASYDSVISVAAIRKTENVADFSQYPTTVYDPSNPPVNSEWDVVEFSGGGERVLSTWPTPDGNVPIFQVSNDEKTYDGVHVIGTGLGDVTQTLVDGKLCDTADISTNWDGHVVLCQRGDITFAKKMNNVANNGGVAVLLYNNVAENVTPTCDGNCTSPGGAEIPGIIITQAEGQYILKNGLELATRIFADDGTGCVDCSGGYKIISGTSMATPGVAAGIAWTWSACGGPSGINNKQLRQLMRDSAKDLSGRHDESGEVYGSGWDAHTGFGLIQLKNALELGNQRFGSTCPIDLAVTPIEVDVCTLAMPSDVNFNVTLDAAFMGTTNMTFSGIPAGTSASYSVNPIIYPTDTTVFTVSNLESVDFANSTITLTATDVENANNSKSSDVTLNTYSSTPENLSLVQPTNAASGVNLMPSFSWTTANQADSYTIEITSDFFFSNIIETQSGLTTPSYTLKNNLKPLTTYYWRVIATNPCGDEISSSQSFRTFNEVCSIYNSTNMPLNISDSPSPGDIQSVLNITDSGIITDVNVVNLTGTHTWINDLSFRLQSPATTEITLMQQSCNNQDNWNLGFDDEAVTAIFPCPPVDGNSYLPANALSLFDGENINGDWMFTINDDTDGDGGSFDSWGLQICYSPSDTNNAPIANNDDYFTNEDTSLNISATNGVLSGDIDVESDQLTAFLVTTTKNGMINLNKNGSFEYVPDDNYCDEVMADSFKYYASDGLNNSNIATVNITVNCVNDPAVAVDDTPPAINKNSGANGIDVLANDIDIENDVFFIIAKTDGINGTVTITNAGHDLSYTPKANYCGVDHFTYSITGGATATVMIEIACGPDEMFNDGFE